MQRCIVLFMLLLLILTLNCAAGQRAHRDRYLITQDEIATVPQAGSVFDIIRYLRPNLLSRETMRAKGASGGMPALVYVNGSRVGFQDMLQSISSAGVIQIKYIDGFEAGGKYGPDSAGGVFLITQQ